MESRDLIEAVFLKMQWEQVGELHWERLFAVSKDSAGRYYGRTLCVAVLQFWNNSVSITFESIDDGCVPLIGPVETKEDAKKRIELIKKEFENIKYIPDMQSLEASAQKLDLFINV